MPQIIGHIVCYGGAKRQKVVGPQVPPAAFNISSDQALASLSKLEPLQAAVVGFGHGDPWRDGVGEAVAQARATGRT